jgi:predicted glycogen debranching enzyme
MSQNPTASSVLHFGRDICGHLATAETREWLVTNGIGGYACGTIAGLLSRHYHGLLNAALQPPVDRTLLLTKLDETVTYREQTYPLYCDRWSDGTIAPAGYLQLERFSLEGTIPTWYYAFADGLLVKRIWMEQGSNTTYIRYCLKRASTPVKLSLRAMINHRKHHNSTRGKDWKMAIDTVPQGIKVNAFEGAVPFYVLCDHGHCTPHHAWYWDYDLAIERYRGIDPNDDHLHGGTFKIELTVGESMTIAATTASPETVAFQGAIQRQQSHEQHLLGKWYSSQFVATQQAPDWMEQLVLAADQFVVSRSVNGDTGGKTVIAGYPWFGDWGRDTMIALPGLAIATGRPEIARPILRTYAKYIDQGMLPNSFPEAGEAPGYNTVDAVLWYFEAIRMYYAVSHDRLLLEELFPALADIIRWHQKGTRYNIHLDSDGLIYAGEPGLQLTWMDAKVDDWVVTPRIGKPIEISALWYNALLTMAKFAEVLGVSGDEYRHMSAHTRHGFQRFWSDELGYCYDLLDGPEGNDTSLRPNQIFAAAFPAMDCWQPSNGAKPQGPPSLGPSLLTAHQQKAVVDTVAQKLLTSYGLRSLSSEHPDYCGHYGGDRYERDGQYHQGTIWGWLIGPFIQAHLRVYQDPDLVLTFLEPFGDHLRDGCIGTLSEIFDADAPFTPRGAYAQAWTVAEVLRAWGLTANLVACRAIAND